MRVRLFALLGAFVLGQEEDVALLEPKFCKAKLRKYQKRYQKLQVHQIIV